MKNTLFALALLFGMFTCCDRADGVGTVLGVDHGAPPDPQLIAQRRMRESPDMANVQKLWKEHKELTEIIAQALDAKDFKAASEAIELFRKKYERRLVVGTHIREVGEYQMAVLYDKKNYDAVLWLAEKSPIRFANVLNGGWPGHVGAFTYYYLAIWKVQGLAAVEQTYRQHVKQAEEIGADRMGAMICRMRLGWFETQFAAGKMKRVDAKLLLTKEAFASDEDVTVWSNMSYRALASLCLADKDYDCLRRVELRATFEGERGMSGMRGTVRGTWETALEPLWRTDGKGPDHLAALAKEYLAGCKDPEARARVQFFMATMHRLQAAMLYRQVMNDEKASDKQMAAPFDMPFGLRGPGYDDEKAPSAVVVFSRRKETARSLSQQAAFYLTNIARGSTVRRWH
jgi:hypothetical protein